MSRSAIAIVAALLILAAAGGIEWYSHMVAGISVGGPVPLQSLAPERLTVRTPTPMKKTPGPARETPATQNPGEGTAAPSRGPTILSMSLSSSVVSGGQVVTGTVQTSSDVTDVQASIAGHSSSLSKVSTGYFALSYRVPQLPFFLRRTYTVQVVARNAAGATASSSLPITIR